MSTTGDNIHMFRIRCYFTDFYIGDSTAVAYIILANMMTTNWHCRWWLRVVYCS